VILFVVDIPQYRTGTVDEQGAQIHISTLADPQQGWSASRGVSLAKCKLSLEHRDLASLVAGGILPYSTLP
jgi:hypothetical protein